MQSETPCPCSPPGTDRHAVAVDPEIKRTVQNRLRRIEGQIRGLQKMVEEERYCADVITQVSSVQEALRGVNRALLQNHLRHCAATALRSDDAAAQDAMVEELVQLMDRGTR
jgi:DNA-binding FrmR family transcriptional regulator